MRRVERKRDEGLFYYPLVLTAHYKDRTVRHRFPSGRRIFHYPHFSHLFPISPLFPLHLPPPPPIRYRRAILEPGASLSGGDMIERFLGRPTRPDTFFDEVLQANGVATSGDGTEEKTA